MVELVRMFLVGLDALLLRGMSDVVDVTVRDELLSNDKCLLFVHTAMIPDPLECLGS